MDNYLEELRGSMQLLDVEEKTAADEDSTPQESGVAAPGTEVCNELAQGLLKVAAEMRGDTPKGGAPADSEVSSSLDEATGVSEEELKKRLMERLKKKREAEGETKREAPAEGGDEEAEGKEAAAQTSHYETLPPDSPPYPKEVGKLMSEAPSIELTEADLKKGMMAFVRKAKNQEAGGKK